MTHTAIPYNGKCLDKLNLPFVKRKCTLKTVENVSAPGSVPCNHIINRRSWLFGTLIKLESVCISCADYETRSNPKKWDFI
jgi:hypothetical protein